METISSIKIPESIMQECKERRSRALREADRHMEELTILNPQIAELRSERLKNAYKLSISLGQLTDESEKAALKENMLSLNKELFEKEQALLKGLGFPVDYLSPRFSCSVCQDTGLVGESVKKPCRCVRQRAIQLKYASSNLENGEYFETYNKNIFKDENQKRRSLALFEYAKTYAAEIPHFKTPNILLIGSSGLGKSFILNCIGHRAFERGLSVVKVTAYNLIKSTLESVRSYESPVDYSDVDLLLIDDLGTEPSINNITQEQLFAVINERHSRMKNTVIATNLPVENIQDIYGERLFSRIISPKYTKTFTLTGDDLRLVAP